MDGEKRAKVVKQVEVEIKQENKARLEWQKTHIEQLEKLEEDYGFDLDVATEIYGEDLLSFSGGEQILKAWEKLLKGLEESPDQPLVLLLVEEEEVSHDEFLGVKYIASPPQLWRAKQYRAVVIESVNLDDIVYSQSSQGGDKKASITINLEGKQFLFSNLDTFSDEAQEAGTFQMMENGYGKCLMKKLDLARKATLEDWKEPQFAVSSPHLIIIPDASEEKVRGLHEAYRSLEALNLLHTVTHDLEQLLSLPSPEDRPPRHSL